MHVDIFNYLETGFSALSLVTTWQSDNLTGDNKSLLILGEDTKTSAATFSIGLSTSDPFIDFAVDFYSCGYNHGYFCGVSTVLECFPSSMEKRKTMILQDGYFYALILIFAGNMMFGVNIKRWHGWLQIFLGFCLGFLMGSVKGFELGISTGLWFSIITCAFGWLRFLKRKAGD